jgi:hypothetical protein
MAGLSGGAGATDVATSLGDVARSGAPRTSSAGGDTLSGQDQACGGGDQTTGGQMVEATSGLTTWDGGW